MFYVFFFFQAEDGIRDYKVTGVQTCALPICFGLPTRARASSIARAAQGAYTWTWSASDSPTPTEWKSSPRPDRKSSIPAPAKVVHSRLAWCHPAAAPGRGDGWLQKGCIR